MAMLVHLIAKGVAGGLYAGAYRGVGVFGDGCTCKSADCVEIEEGIYEGCGTFVCLLGGLRAGALSLGGDIVAHVPMEND